MEWKRAMSFRSPDRIASALALVVALVACDTGSPSSQVQTKPAAAKPVDVQPVAKAAAQPTAAAVTAPAPAGGVDCKALVEDAVFLEELFAKVRAKGYAVTKKGGSEIDASLDERFSLQWSEKRGVPELAEKGEPRVADAGRTMAVTCSGIVREFACDGDKKLIAQFGPDIVRDYARDFRQFVTDVSSACGS